MAELAVTMLPGPYRVPAYHAHVSVVTTNKTPCGTYRAPGRYEGTFARERLLDAAADRLGVDPVELRRRNLLTPAELPLERGMRTLGTEIVLDPGDYPGLLDATLDGVGYGDWRAAAASARRDGRLAGTGVACLLEKSGLGPYETARVDVQPDGRVRAATGGTSVGQGIETVIATIVADELGVAPDDVDVRHGDTDLVPDGVGSWASRSTVVGGSAALDAAGRVADTARRVGAGLLGVDEDKVALADGRVRITGGPPAGSGVGEVSLAEVAAACAPPAGGAGLGSDGHFAVQRMTYPYGVHCCLVEVDPETGGVTVQRYAVGYEVGRAINRQLVEGQLAGGVAQGLGGALMEEFAYDGVSGQPLATTFIDYLLPTAAEVPDVTVLVFEDAPAPDNPLGAHGAGEGGVSAVGAAVAGAVADALGVADSVQSLPLAPALVRRAVRRADPGRAAQPSG